MKYCEEYAALLDLFVDGELSLEEMLRVQEHLDTCPACRAYVDDALAMSLTHVTKIPIQWIYLISDMTVLLLSLSYIPLYRILCSLITVILSGQIIGWIQNIPTKEKPA